MSKKSGTTSYSPRFRHTQQIQLKKEQEEKKKSTQKMFKSVSDLMKQKDSV